MSDTVDYSKTDWEKVDWSKPIPRAMAEAHLRIIRRTCRGNMLLNDTERAAYREKHKAVSVGSDEYKALHQELAGKMGTLAAASADPVFQLIYAFPDSVGKGMCGADDNALILSEPLDGKFHRGKCPKCGAPKTWTPAKYLIEE